MKQAIPQELLNELAKLKLGSGANTRIVQCIVEELNDDEGVEDCILTPELVNGIMRSVPIAIEMADKLAEKLREKREIEKAAFEPAEVAPGTFFAPTPPNRRRAIPREIGDREERRFGDQIAARVLANATPNGCDIEGSVSFAFALADAAVSERRRRRAKPETPENAAK